MSFFKILFCDECNTNQVLPNVDVIPQDVLEVVYGKENLQYNEEGTLLNDTHNRGVYALGDEDPEDYIPTGWVLDDERGHLCVFCVAQKILEDRRATEGEDEGGCTFEVPELVGHLVEPVKIESKDSPQS